MFPAPWHSTPLLYVPPPFHGVFYSAQGSGSFSARLSALHAGPGGAPKCGRADPWARVPSCSDRPRTWVCDPGRPREAFPRIFQDSLGEKSPFYHPLTQQTLPEHPLCQGCRGRGDTGITQTQSPHTHTPVSQHLMPSLVPSVGSADLPGSRHTQEGHQHPRCDETGTGSGSWAGQHSLPLSYSMDWVVVKVMPKRHLLACPPRAWESQGGAMVVLAHLGWGGRRWG